jgi:DNA repair photolyase
MAIKRQVKRDIELNYPSPRWSGEILDCSMPMTFDQYDHCSFDCLYCFSYFQKCLKEVNPLFTKQNTHYRDMAVRGTDPKKIDKLFHGKLKSQFWPYIQARVPMQWGGLSDPFDMFEKKYGVGYDILKILKDYPLCFSTKGDWFLHGDINDIDEGGNLLRVRNYHNLIAGNRNWNWKISIINYGSDLSSKIEKGVPSPDMRLRLIKKLSVMGTGGVTLRLRPFIIGMSSLDYEILIDMAAKAGCDAVSTEFFCLEARANEALLNRYTKMSEALGFDILDFYRKNSPHQSGYLRLNWKIKEPYIIKMRNLCHKLGMKFFVSDAHWKDQCDGGSCCGLPESWNYQRGQFTNALYIAKTRKDGLVYWSKDMAPHLAMFKTFLWRKAENYNTQGTKVRCARWNQTMFDYIHEIWNSPTNAKSPYRYFQGLLYPERKDKNDDIVYKYKPY